MDIAKNFFFLLFELFPFVCSCRVCRIRIEHRKDCFSHSCKVDPISAKFFLQTNIF